MKTVKAAVVGCGQISSTYIPNLKNLFSIIDLVAVCDLFPESAQRRAEEFGIEKVMTLEEIEQSEEIEMVINLTGPDTHYELTKRFLLAGKHVFSEKTIASTIEEGKELVALAEEKGLYLGVAPDTILGAGIQTARKAIDAGLIGTPTSCFVAISRNQSLNSEMFRFIQKSLSGAFPYDYGVYYIASILALLGPVQSVTGVVKEGPVHKKNLTHLDNPDQWQLPGYQLLSGTLQFQSGVIGAVLLDGTSINYEHPMFTIYGTEGILKVGNPDNFDSNVTLIRAESEPLVLPFTHGFNGRPLPDSVVVGSRGFRGVGAAEMAWAIREGREARCCGKFGLQTLEVLQGMERSALNGKPWKIDTNFSMKPLKAGYYDTTFGGALRAGAEGSLRD